MQTNFDIFNIQYKNEDKLASNINSIPIQHLMKYTLTTKASN
jgi:hypothetical protein